MQSNSTRVFKARVSTVFNQRFTFERLNPDLVLISWDGAFFFVHSAVLQESSENNFDGHLSQVQQYNISWSASSQGSDKQTSTRSLDLMIESEITELPACTQLAEPSHILSIVLHCVYGFHTTIHVLPPPLNDLCGAVETLWRYGIRPLQKYVNPSTTLFKTLLRYAESNERTGERGASAQAPNALIHHNKALQVYALAATYGLHDLATDSSRHLLSIPLLQLTDEDAVRIGSIYLKHLFLLQHDRSEALKKIIMKPPNTVSLWFSKSLSFSSAKHTCSADEMDGVARAWTYAAANVVLSNQSNFDCDQLDATVRPAGDDISCLACRRLWAERVWEVTTTYSRVKVSSPVFPT